MTEASCSFCARSVAVVQEVARNDSVRVIYPLAPFIRPYVFIIPTRHVERLADVTRREMVHIHGTAKAILAAFGDLYGATALNVFVNDGVAAGQSVPHVHFHVFGRREGEPENPFPILNDKSRWPGPLPAEEIRLRADQIRAALSPYWGSK